MKLATLLVALTLTATTLSPAAAADWTPDQWKYEDTLQFLTDCPDEGPHWSYVWLVVLDGELWVRLGSKAAGRVDCNKAGRTTSVKIAEREFPSIEMVESPEMAERVAEAMAEKYWSDFAVAWMDHPYTMKLVPKPE